MEVFTIEKLNSFAPTERAALLLNAREDQWFDRKSILTKSKDLARAVVAFANAEGGYLAVGLHNGTIEGLETNPSKKEEIEREIFNLTTPSIRVVVSPVVIDYGGSRHTVLLVKVEPSELVHETSDNRCFLRVGDTNKELTYQQRNDLEYDRGIKQFDSQVITDTGISGLDMSLVEHYANSIGYKGSDPTEALRARHLLKGSMRTNACHLLFAKDPLDIFPNASIRVIKFIGDERGQGRELNIEAGKDKRLDLPIPLLIEETIKTVDSFIHKRESLGSDAKFEHQDIIPRDVWIEAIVNAVVHRSYSRMGDYIRVEIYASRIEIENPGNFLQASGSVDLTNISRFARNPSIARVCTELKYGMELGEGIKRMVREMRSRDYIDPSYIQKQNSVKLILEATRRLGEDLINRMPHNSELVLNIIKHSERQLGTGEIAELADMKHPTVRKRLEALQKEGLIERLG